MFTTLREAQMLTDTATTTMPPGPPSSLGCRPPTPEAILPRAGCPPYATLQSALGLVKAAGLLFSGGYRCREQTTEAMA